MEKQKCSTVKALYELFLYFKHVQSYSPKAKGAASR